MTWLVLLASGCYLFGSRWKWMFGVGLALQSWYLADRGIQVGRLPLLGPHDTIILFSTCIAAAGLSCSYNRILQSERWFLPAAGVAAGGFTLLACMFPALNIPLPQILETAWFEIHVVLAFIGYALFLLGGILSAAYILAQQRDWLNVQYKIALAGWSFFSVSMIAGGIWGYYAWGTYWLWTPKELWTSILWLFYALHLHLRLKGATGDRAAAWCGIAGVVIMLFTYLGVSLLMKSSHSF